MAQDLFKEIRFSPKGEFSKEQIIREGVIITLVPTSESIFKSDIDQKIFLELWNETEKSVDIFVQCGKTIIQNSSIGVCDEKVMAHTFHQIEIKEGEELFICAGEEKAISYNIIL